MPSGSRVLVGRGEEVVGVPEAEWWAELQDHETGRPVSPALIASDVGAAVPEVVAALGTLEARMFFLVRDGSGAV